MTSFLATRCICLLAALFVMFSSMTVSATEPPKPDATYTVEIAEVGKSTELAALLTKKGIKTAFAKGNIRIVDEQTNCAVWIGKNVPLSLLQAVMPETLRLYPFLKFFYIVGERGEVAPDVYTRTIYIGGSIDAALYKKLNVIDRQEFLKTLAAAKTIEELHKYLLEKNKALKSAPGAEGD